MFECWSCTTARTTSSARATGTSTRSSGPSEDWWGRTKQERACYISCFIHLGRPGSLPRGGGFRWPAAPGRRRRGGRGSGGPLLHLGELRFQLSAFGHGTGTSGFGALPRVYPEQRQNSTTHNTAALYFRRARRVVAQEVLHLSAVRRRTGSIAAARRVLEELHMELNRSTAISALLLCEPGPPRGLA